MHNVSTVSDSDSHLHMKHVEDQETSRHSLCAGWFTFYFLYCSLGIGLHFFRGSSCTPSESTRESDYSGSWTTQAWRANCSLCNVFSAGRGSSPIIHTKVDCWSSNLHVTPYTTLHYRSEFVESWVGMFLNDCTRSHFKCVCRLKCVFPLCVSRGRCLMGVVDAMFVTITRMCLRLSVCFENIGREVCRGVQGGSASLFDYWLTGSSGEICLTSSDGASGLQGRQD